MEKIKSTNTVLHKAKIDRVLREEKNGHKSVVIWFTGYSGSGKSTLAHGVEEKLYHIGCRTYVLDGDNVRHGLCSDLEFSEQDRVENIRRNGEVAKLFIEAGIIVLTAFISPYKKDREKVRTLVGASDFIEIYCQCPIETCEQRDVKGLYKKARAGVIKEFTGISSPYEEPENPDLVINTSKMSLDGSVDKIINYLFLKRVIKL